MTLAEMITTSHVAITMAKSPAGVLMHGPTFMGNPLAVAVARASVDLFEQSPWRARVQKIEFTLRERLSEWKKYSCVTDVRVLGAVGVVEVDRPVDVAEMQKVFVEKGAWIRPFRNLLYIMPPYISTEEDLHIVCHALEAGLQSMG